MIGQVPLAIPTRTALIAVLGILIGAASLTLPVDLAASTPWPVGLVTGLALHSRRGPAAVLVATSMLSLAAGLLIVGYDLVEAITIPAAHVVGTLVGLAVLTSAGRRRIHTLRSEGDLARYIGASAAAGLAAGMTSLAIDVVGDDSLVDAVALGVQHATSDLILLPWFLAMLPNAGRAPWPERVVQGATLLGAVALVAAPQVLPVPLLLVATVLAWGARRLSTAQALVQVYLSLLAITVITAADLGPLAGIESFLGIRSDASQLLLRGVAVCCALVVVPIAMTVSGQRHALRDSRLARARAEAVSDTLASAAVIVSDRRGRVVRLNSAAERLLGHHAEQAVDRFVQQVVPAEEIVRLAAAEGVPADFESLVAAMAGRRTAFEVWLRRGDGTLRLHRMTLNRLEVDGAAEFVTVSEDVTAQHEEAEALRAAVERLREADTAKDTFVSGVSHELRTPLTTITGFVELLRDGDLGGLTAAQDDALARVAASNERLLRLVDDLLAVARIGETDLVAQRERVDLGEVVTAGCDLVEPQGAARGVSVELELPAAPMLVRGDATLLERMVVNLVSNAVKFSREQGCVRVSVRLREDPDDETPGRSTVELRVADEGIGIPADELEQLFSRFFRSRLARQRAVPGSGLGLVIARSVVEDHDGSIGVTSTEGVGTVVTVLLPPFLEVDLDAAAGPAEQVEQVEVGETPLPGM